MRIEVRIIIYMIECIDMNKKVLVGIAVALVIVAIGIVGIKAMLGDAKTELPYEEQTEKIVHLIEVHDDFGRLGKDLEEIVLMEADTLGSIDLGRVTPTFDFENGLQYIEGLKRKRLPKFQTELGKQLLDKLLPAFIGYFEEMKP